MNKVLVSGIKPTGTPHIGNYLGAIKQWVELQNDYDCYFFLADLHALTTRPEPKELKKLSYQTVALLLALGINPHHSTIYIQSHLSEPSELSWLMSNFTMMGELNRMTQFKEKSVKHEQNVGLYTYPVLMSADVAMLNAQVVPVGDDQIQHLELTREIIRRMNKTIGTTIVEPKPLVTKQARIMSLSDPTSKMSKTEPAVCIFLSDDEATIERKIKRAVTATSTNGKISPSVENLFTILEGFADDATYNHFVTLRDNGKLQFSELKATLAEEIINFLKPVQKAYQSLLKDKSNLDRILKDGEAKTSAIASKNLQAIKTKIGLI